MAFLREFGAWLPDKIVTNEEAGGWVGTDPAWVKSVSGIDERRFAPPDMSVAECAARAGHDCLQRAGVDASSLGMLIVASGSAERSFPGPAAETAQRLGAGQCPAIDLPMASAGSIFGLALAAKLSHTVGPTLVIGAEKMSSVVLREPREKGVAILFGDGAGACLVDPAQGKARIAATVLHSDGSFAEDLTLEHSQPLKMNGRSVILQASRKIPAAIRSVLDRNALSPADVAVFLMHQANQNLIVKVAESLSVEASRFYSNIHRYGNTSSASMLIAAAEWCRESVWPSSPVVFAGFGAGFHWGALLATP